MGNLCRAREHSVQFFVQFFTLLLSMNNRNGYQEYFLGGKGSRRVGLTTLPLHVPIVLKSERLNILEP